MSGYWIALMPLVIFGLFALCVWALLEFWFGDVEGSGGCDE